ncbi:MAG: hypothetical protein KDA71_02930 [Planctomycetales bacterium]|nr:hypothetical protein [Planctomycetales bacterium]
MNIQRIPRIQLITITVLAAMIGRVPAADLNWPPTLPGDQQVATDTSPAFLKPSETLRDGVQIAKTPPTVDFVYYPGQTYATKLWSAWGDNLVVGDKCYSAIGDHDAPAGNAQLYEYDSSTKTMRLLVDVRKFLDLPAEHYSPGKIHSHIGLGKDGWLYFSTHRGSTRITTAANHFSGDWILRHHPQRGDTEIVAHAPLPMQCLPCGQMDGERMIFYNGTADGDYKNKRVQFLAYDLVNRKVLYSDDHGPARAMIVANSTGRVYFHGRQSKPTGEGAAETLVRFDPAKPGEPQPIEAAVGMRAASQETPDGIVYTIDGDGLWAFNTKTERAESLGSAAVASKDYTASLDVDPHTWRYLYYVPGAHGGAELDGAPLVQYDVKTRTRKVIAFLHPFYFDKYGYVACGSYGVAVSPTGDKVYITWNGARGATKADLAKRVKWDTCALTVVHIPESERQP